MSQGRTISVLNGTSGLNNAVDPVRLKNSKSGRELAVAVDVNIDDTGRISRRRGCTLRLAGSFHSLFSAGEYALAVSGDALTVVNADYTTSSIRNVTPGYKMSYALADDRVYYANGIEKGYVKDRVSYSWVKGEYVGPVSVRELYDPPVGTILQVWNGRMWVAENDLLWFSEPFAYGAFRKASNWFWFPSSIRMVAPVADGLYISDNDQTYFLFGTNPEKASMVVVASYPAIEGTNVSINQGEFGPMDQTGPGLAALWGSTRGLCFGGPGGVFSNLTSKRLVLPSAVRGCACVVDDQKYICTLNG